MRKVTEDRIRKEHNSEGLGVLVFLEARGLSKEQLEIKLAGGLTARKVRFGRIKRGEFSEQSALLYQADFHRRLALRAFHIARERVHNHRLHLHLTRN